MSDLDSNDIECPHCGATFYYELTRCPKCGRAIYPSDFDDYEEEEGETETEGWGIDPGKLGATTKQKLGMNTIITAFLGFLLGGAIAFTIGMIGYLILDAISQKIVTNSPESWIRFLPLVGVLIGSLVGGYFSSAITQIRPHLSGLIIGCMNIGTAIIMTATKYNLDEEPLFVRPETIPWWTTIILAGILGGEIYRRASERYAVKQLFTPRSENQLYTELLTKVQFDRLTAESLITYEQKRAPRATRFEWIQNAIDRWERDNRAK